MSSSIRHTFLETLLDERRFVGKLPIQMYDYIIIKPLLRLRTIFLSGELSEQ